jgi:hypothetical protein
VLTLGSVPVPITAAPGAGLVIVPLAICAVYLFAVTPFNGTSGGLTVQYGNNLAAEVMTLLPTGFWDQSSSQVTLAAVSDSSAPLSSAVNAPLTLAYGGADLTTGGGSLVITTVYATTPAS